ncbi:MAG: hypothetical protein AAF737_02735 [Pseudomonadota bacterium]
MRAIIVHAAAAVALISLAIVGGIGAAAADSRIGTTAKFAPVAIQTASKPNPLDHGAKVWGNFCHLEFGPNPKWPSEAGLKKCLEL